MRRATQFYDGPSLALAAGTYIIIANVLVKSPNNTSMRLTAKLWDGAATVWEGSEETRASQGGGQAGWAHLSVESWVVLAAPTTVKISVASTAAGCTIANTPGDNAAGIGNTSSVLHAIKIA